jgi:hypothetical protein
MLPVVPDGIRRAARRGAAARRRSAAAGSADSVPGLTEGAITSVATW